MKKFGPKNEPKMGQKWGKYWPKTHFLILLSIIFHFEQKQIENKNNKFENLKNMCQKWAQKRAKITFF